jgi:CRISPR system Cascade subunit CasB
MNDGATLVKDFVWRKIHALAMSTDDSATRATLARLRRAIGKPPGSVPEIWGATLRGLPDELMSKNGTPTIGEWAVHTALTLFALHQQGKDLEKRLMSKDGATLGLAIRKLIESDDDEPRIKRRFDASATSDSQEEFSHHLRGLIQLLKAKDVSLDYPVLAKDLFWFQIPETRDSVRLRWGQDFYRNSKQEDINQDESGKEDNENEDE